MSYDGCMATTFGEKVEYLLESRGWEKPKLVEILSPHIKRATIYNWFTGTAPSAINALIVARVFGVPLEWLVDDQAEVPPPNPPLPDVDEQFLLQMARRVGIQTAIDRVLNVTIRHAVDPHRGPAKG